MRREVLVRDSLDFIERHIREPLSVEIISCHAGYSPYYFSRMFRRHMGVSVMEYVTRRKLIRASGYILEGSKIIDAAMSCGYGSHSGFTRAFSREFGFSPALLKAMELRLREGERGMEHVFMRQRDVHMTKEELVKALVETVEENRISLDREEIRQVYGCADRAYEGKKRYSGDEYVTHPLHVAVLLAEMEAEPEVILSGMLCDVFKKTNTLPSQLEVPEKVKELVKDVHEADEKNMAEWKEAVFLVKLAERLHNMRTVEYMEREIRRAKARETIEVFLPAAAALGNEKLAAELNDLALMYMEA
ncbi:MAG: HD domain-containing protein [Hungatella sp.]|nr:HD domain-containing protein [Hungatella sp.]